MSRDDHVATPIILIAIAVVIAIVAIPVLQMRDREIEERTVRRLDVDDWRCTKIRTAATTRSPAQVERRLASNGPAVQECIEYRRRDFY
jgi:hypothetical protein